MKPEFQTLIDQISEKNPFLSSWNLHFTDLSAQKAQAVLETGKSDLNMYGAVCGGSLFALADTAAGACALASGKKAVTLDSSIQFLRPARPGLLKVSVRSLHVGKTVGVYEVQIFDSSDHLNVSAVFTMYFLKENSDSCQLL